MTKQELMENYTMEELAGKYLRLQERFSRYTEVIKGVIDTLPEELKNGTEFHLEIDKLQSEVEKYRKAFNDEKDKYNRQICEYQNKINELEKRIVSSKTLVDFLPAEPIKVADMLISTQIEYENDALTKAFSGNGKGKYNLFNVSELRQIAEHLLIYCSANEVNE